MPLSNKEVNAALGTARAERANERSIAKADKLHRQQLRRENIKKRNRIQTEAARKDIKLSEVREREQIKAQSRAAQRFEKEQARAAKQQDSGPSGYETTGRAIGTGIAGTGNLIGGNELFSTTLWLMFGLIIVYLLVTNATDTSNYVGRMGALLHKLTSTAPLFAVANKSTG